MEYNFPVTDKYDALEVTQPEFDPEEKIDELYVNLDGVRSDVYLRNMKFNLRVNEDNVLEKVSANYCKLLFSGHRGTGKTTELRRLVKDLHHGSGYFTVFIELEKETELNKFERDDFYLLLILKLMEKIHECDIDATTLFLKDLAKKLNLETEIETKSSAKASASAEGKGGLPGIIQYFLGFTIDFKSTFAADTSIAQTTRQKLRTSIKDIITSFNTYLGKLRKTLQDDNERPKDILFIIDGSEKIHEQIYKDLFITDAHLVHAIDVNMIIAVRIDAYYDITYSPGRIFTDAFTIPMIKINDNSLPLFLEIITKRIDGEVFFEPGVLNYLAQHSGGCVRQMIHLTHQSLQVALGKRISSEHAEKAVYNLGLMMRNSLTSEHVSVAESGNFANADKLVRDMLQSLVVLSYNGHRALNPLLKGFINSDTNRATA